VSEAPELSESDDADVLASASALLAQLYRMRPDQAFDTLLDAAMRHHLSPVQLARGLLELVSDIHRSVTSMCAPVAAAYQQWGRLIEDGFETARRAAPRSITEILTRRAEADAAMSEENTPTLTG
jgi:hypothetical protein